MTRTKRLIPRKKTRSKKTRSKKTRIKKTRSKKTSLKYRMRGGVLPASTSIQDEGVLNENYYKVGLPMYENKLPERLQDYRSWLSSFVILNDDLNTLYLIKDKGSIMNRPWIGHSSVLSGPARESWSMDATERSRATLAGEYNANNPDDTVFLAGTCYFDNGVLVKLTNWSGHYPTTYREYEEAFSNVSKLFPGVEIADYSEEAGAQESSIARLSSQFPGNWDTKESVRREARLTQADKTPDELTKGELEAEMGAVGW